MIGDKEREKSEDGVTQNNEGSQTARSAAERHVVDGRFGADRRRVCDSRASAATGPDSASGQQPNIIVIMGDDIGWFNIGAYHHGIMAGRTPNLDKLAAEGMLFTDYYAEASCTAGRANFITGELPIRTG